MLPPELRIAARTARGPLAAARDGWRGTLPARYGEQTWDLRFRAELERRLRPGLAILDVGAGARPVLPASERPRDCTYAGLDVSAAELERAPAGSYDERFVADVGARRPELERRFDLALSWMVLEHVDSLPAALANLRAYLRPGGALIAQLPGAFSLAALANRLTPAPLARRFLRRTQGRGAEDVFPARYHRCWQGALERLLADGWRAGRVEPLFSGVFYLSRWASLRAAYLAYEEWAWRRGHDNLAPYYLLVATAA